MTFLEFSSTYFIPDWISLIVIAAISLGIQWVPPIERTIINTDYISYPIITEQVDMTILLIVSCAVPVFIIILWNLLTHFIPSLYSYRVKMDWCLSILGLAQSIMITTFFSESIKRLTGIPRPNFVAMCQWDGVKCNSDIESQINSRSSFPSGHTAVAYAGLNYLSLWLCGKFSLYKNNFQFWRIIPATFPFLAAGIIAITRLQDYRHSEIDIVSGCVMGMFISSFFYFLHFPGIFSPNSNTPKLYIDKKEESKNNEISNQLILDVAELV